MYSDTAISLNLMMEYWDIEIRFWDIRVFLDKNRHLLLNLEKIRERHKDSCDCYYVFLLLFLSILDILFDYWVYS